jgi:hypothetical protein
MNTSYFNAREFDCWITGERNLPELPELPRIATPKVKSEIIRDSSWQYYANETPVHEPTPLSTVAHLSKMIRWDLDNDRAMMDHALGRKAIEHFGTIYTPQQDRHILEATDPLHIIAKAMGRSYCAVRNRRRRLLAEMRQRAEQFRNA